MYFFNKGRVILINNVLTGIVRYWKSSNFIDLKCINQTISAKVSSQKGNSPYYLLKFKNIIKYKNLKIKLYLGGRLGSSHPIMKA